MNTRRPVHVLIRRTPWVAMLLALVLAGCSAADREWRTTNISGIMPPLNFRLTDAATGRAVTAHDFRGKVVLLYFGYTHCPDVCPTTLSAIATALRDLGSGARDVRVLFVTVDPARDSVPLLKAYAAAFGPRFVGLRGEAQALQRLTRRYRVTYGYGRPDAHGDYEVTHSSAVYVFDRSGKVRLLARPTDRAADLTHDLGRLLAES